MSLLNSLFSGVSGLRNHQVMLDVIGNNIANVNSIGYKGSRVTFSDTFNQFVRFGTNPTEANGGTNSFQIGLGMKVNSIDRNWNQGTFERTGVVTDLALQGDGLFVLEQNGERFYSRAGTFVFDSDYKLVNPQNGAIVQGKVATDQGEIPPGNNLVDIRIGQELRNLPAVSTTLAEWGGNLDSTSSKTASDIYAASGNLISTTAVNGTITEENLVYDAFGTAYNLAITYEKTAADTWNVNWELQDPDDATTVYADNSAAPDVIVFDASGDLSTLNGAAYDATTNTINVTYTDVDFDINVEALTQTSSSTTASSSVDGNREPTVVNGTVSVFDSLGNPHTLTVSFTKTSSNNWNWRATVPEASGTLTENEGSIQFNSNGSIFSITPATPNLTFNPQGGAAAQNIQLDFGEVDGFDGLTQTSSNSVVSALSQDGSSAATLSDVSIDQNGYLVGIFSNGFSRNLGQVMLATFPNRNGLASAGDNMFSVSANSGDPLIGEPGEVTNTTMQSGALEQSNVDLSEEFTRMIVSQRGFQANARVITVSDQILQETTNLIR